MGYLFRVPIFVMADNKIIKLIRGRIQLRLFFIAIINLYTFIFSCEEFLTYFLHILKPTSPSASIFIFVPIHIHIHISTHCMLTGIHNLFTSSLCSYFIITWRTRLSYRLNTFFIAYWKLLYFLFVLYLFVCSWSVSLFSYFVCSLVFRFNFTLLVYFYYSLIFVLLIIQWVSSTFWFNSCLVYIALNYIKLSIFLVKTSICDSINLSLFETLILLNRLAPCNKIFLICLAWLIKSIDLRHSCYNLSWF